MSSKNTYFIDTESAIELARLQQQERLVNEVFDQFPKQFTPYSGCRVLDLGCGPGGWLLEVAASQPDCTTVGVDISERMIQYARAKAEIQELSTQFRVMDILKFPWDFPDSHFDLVNIRFATGFVPVATWSSLLEEVRRVLKPEGAFRHIESVYMSAPGANAQPQLSRVVYKAMYLGGLGFSEYETTTGAVLAKLLRRQKFEKITTTPYVADVSYGAPLHLPIFEDFCVSSRLLKPFCLKVKICTSEEFDEMIEGLEREFQEKDFTGHWYFGSVACTKPSTALECVGFRK